MVALKTKIFECMALFPVGTGIKENEYQIKTFSVQYSKLHKIMFLVQEAYEPRHEKTCLWGLRPGKTQTSPLSYRD